MRVETMRIVSSHPSQGEFVEINVSDFDPATMQKYPPEPKPEPKPETVKRGK